MDIFVINVHATQGLISILQKNLEILNKIHRVNLI